MKGYTLDGTNWFADKKDRTFTMHDIVAFQKAVGKQPKLTLQGIELPIDSWKPIMRKVSQLIRSDNGDLWYDRQMSYMLSEE